MPRRLAAFVSLAVAGSAGWLVLGAAAAQTQDAPEFRAGTAVVLLDVVARDKKGRPIRDLRPEELQVFENDQRCEVQSFRLVEGVAGTASVTETTAAPPPAEPGTARAEVERGPLNLVTMVFEGLDIEANRVASKAAKDFVERGMDERAQAAVFVLARGLLAVQPYTNDKQLLIAAIDEATSGRNLKERSLAEAANRASRNAAIASGYPVAASAGAPGEAAEASGERVVAAKAQGPGAPATTGAAAAAVEGPAAVERKRREVVSNALRMADSLQRQAEGNWTLYPLLALVKAQAALQGRKTLLYFSSGILVPPNLEDVFKTIVSEANRSNVSVYSVDARGLTARGDINSSAAALRDAATTSMQQQMKGAGEATTAAEMQIMDTVDTSLRSNAQQTLSDLAEGTGGFLVANANDFGKAVDRVADDIRGYYEVTYAPALANFDGSYRKITVKVARKDVVLQTRRGYFALPPTETIVLPYEIPLVAALQAGAPRQDFELAAGALRFAAGPEGTETAVVVEVPLAPFDFTVDNKKKTFALRLSTLAVVKDAEGRVVERFSDEYPLAGPLDALADLKKSNAVLRRTVSLLPGAYTLETVAQARESGKTSVRKTQFEVPASGEGPQLSSLCVLRRADPLPAGAPTGLDPFRVETNRLVPVLDGRVSKAAMPNLSFFARVYPVAEAGPASLTLDFVRDGKVVGRAKPETPAAGADGRIAFVQGVPSASLPPGPYEVRLSVEQDGMSATEMTRFELVP